MSKDIGDFVGPTRVIGRLPDAVGGGSAEQVVGLIKSAAAFTGTPGDDSLVISAKVWSGATRENVRLAFGVKRKIAISPKGGPHWSKAALAAPLHFINCHGATADHRFYGDPDYPEAHLSGNLAGALTAGTVVAAECCYGAQLFDAGGGADGIALAYLLHGAAGFCGSTNTAYGDATAKTRCNADILCTAFMQAIVKGATTGRALLQARQEFIKVASADGLDPFDLKTIGQFLLLGDPSLRPFGTPGTPKAKSKSKAKASGPVPAAQGAKALARHKAHRQALKSEGIALEQSTPRVVPAAPVADAAATKRMAAVIGKHSLAPGKVLSFSVQERAPRAAPKAKSKSPVAPPPAEKIQVMFAAGTPEVIAPEPVPVLAGMVEAQPELPERAGAALAAAAPQALAARGLMRRVSDAILGRAPVARPAPRLRSIRAVVARTRGGKVVSYKTVWSKVNRFS